MKRNTWILLGVIVLVVAFCVFLVIPKSPLWGDKIKASLGLDLVGGTELTYEADLSESHDKLKDLENLKSVFNQRVNQLGVSEPTIQTSGSNRIIIELPGITNIDEAVEKIGQTYELVFMTQADETTGVQLKDYYEPDYYYPGYWVKSDLSGRNLSSAEATFQGGNQTAVRSQPVVSIRFDNSGREKFRTLTRDNLNKQIAIVLDNMIVSAPTVNEEITSGEAIISGSKEINEAQELSKRLNEGMLPVPATLIGQQNVGATLGRESLTTSIVAGLFGLFLVFIFMLSYYGFLGIVSFLSLIIYVIVTLAIYKVIPVTLTLSGIAGFILSVGMAVDANVLTFERLKEELKFGKKPNLAIIDGFKRSWSSIRDGNITTILVCIILFYTASSGPVKGFALTLLLGILVSMLTAIFVTRTILLSISFSPLKRFINAQDYQKQ